MFVMFKIEKDFAVTYANMWCNAGFLNSFKIQGKRNESLFW